MAKLEDGDSCRRQGSLLPFAQYQSLREYSTSSAIRILLALPLIPDECNYHRIDRITINTTGEPIRGLAATAVLCAA
jgi:hypothetical protein